MHIKAILSLLAGVWVCFFATVTEAAPILLTISISENGQTTGWWPNQPGLDKAWVEDLSRHGVQVLNPAAMSNMPRLSPIVYGQKPLSDTNARTMASLFGAQNVLNGNVIWQCQANETSVSKADAVHCTGNASLTLLYGHQESAPMQFTASAYGQDFETAKAAVRARITADMALPVMAHTATKGDIPKYIDKPVMLFDPLPDADTLVALRKQLKRVPGVTDVAERWVSNGVLALEINPDTPTLSLEGFSAIIQGFMGQPAENFIIRETQKTEAGAIFEVVKY